MFWCDFTKTRWAHTGRVLISRMINLLAIIYRDSMDRSAWQNNFGWGEFSFVTLLIGYRKHCRMNRATSQLAQPAGYNSSGNFPYGTRKGRRAGGGSMGTGR